MKVQGKWFGEEEYGLTDKGVRTILKHIRWYLDDSVDIQLDSEGKVQATELCELVCNDAGEELGTASPCEADLEAAVSELVYIVCDDRGIW